MPMNLILPSRCRALTARWARGDGGPVAETAVRPGEQALGRRWTMSGWQKGRGGMARTTIRGGPRCARSAPGWRREFRTRPLTSVRRAAYRAPIPTSRYVADRAWEE